MLSQTFGHFYIIGQYEYLDTSGGTSVEDQP